MNTISQRIASVGKDSLGRFTWIDFYGKSKYLRIYTIYRINPGSDTTSGPDTCWFHQRNALLQKNNQTDPRKQVLLDICASIRKDITMNRSIIICGDINEDVYASIGFNQAMCQLGLTNLMEQEVSRQSTFRTRYPGSKAIDGIWCSPDLLPSVIRVAVAPFHFLFSSDHRGIFMDLDIKAFLDLEDKNILPSPYRRLKFTIPKRVSAYTDACIKLWKHQKMTLRIQQATLMLPNISLSDRTQLLNKLDSEIQNIMTHGEKNCCTVGRHCVNLFSKDFAKALRSNRQMSTQLSKTLMLFSNNQITEEAVIKSAKSKREAKRHLKLCKRDEKTLRDNMFDEIAKDTLKLHPSRGKKKKSVIKQLKHCESSRIDAKKIKFATNGPVQVGISYVLIPDLSSYTVEEKNSPTFDHKNLDIIWERTQRNNGKDIANWEKIEDIPSVITYVTHFLKRHFGQSTGTPFASIYWMQRLTDPAFQQDLLDGKVTHDSSLPDAANEILQTFQLKDNVKPIPLLPTWKEFQQFIASSNEKTSASPSSRHYGHYKALLHSAPSVLRGIYDLMCLALQNGIVLERWKQTVTTLICKDDNTPYIHRLRPIHIIEAELQFFSKFQWSKLLIHQAEKLHHISSSQFGGRKHHQAQSSVINTILLFDIHRQRRQSFTFNDDDLRANYDRELAHFTAAETRSHGLTYEAGKLLVDITQQQKFYIKTKNGVSDSFYQFSHQEPVWGLGQGISWAGSCWQFTATTIEKCMQKTCKGAYLPNPSNTISIHPFLKFFIDDTTKVCNMSTPSRSLLQQTQYNMQQHADFVFSTGGALALDKCRYYFNNYSFDRNHDPYIQSISRFTYHTQLSHKLPSYNQTCGTK